MVPLAASDDSLPARLLGVFLPRLGLTVARLPLRSRSTGCGVAWIAWLVYVGIVAKPCFPESRLQSLPRSGSWSSTEVRLTID